jgi:hypothetical protein
LLPVRVGRFFGYATFLLRFFAERPRSAEEVGARI